MVREVVGNGGAHRSGTSFRQPQRVDERVTAEITIATELLATLATIEWLDVGVREQMGLQIGPLIEASTAEMALVRAVLLVQYLVHGQRSRLAESFTAVGALEGLLLGVNVTMIAKMVLSAKGFATDITRKWSLIGVSSLVYEQIVGLGELALAEAANELLPPSLPLLLPIGQGFIFHFRLIMILVMIVGVFDGGHGGGWTTFFTVIGFRGRSGQVGEIETFPFLASGRCLGLCLWWWW